MVTRGAEAAREACDKAGAAKPEGVGAGQPAESAASGRSLPGSGVWAAGSSIRSAVGASPPAAAAALPAVAGQGAQPLFRRPRGKLKVLDYYVAGKLAEDMDAVAKHWLKNESYLSAKTKALLSPGATRHSGRPPPPKVPIKSFLGVLELREMAAKAKRKKREALEEDEKKCRESAAAAIEDALGLERDEPVDVAWLLQEGLQSSPGIIISAAKQYEVDRTDRRKALWGQQGQLAIRDIPSCTFVGTYGGTLQYKSHYDEVLMRESSTGRYNINKLELDAYAADFHVHSPAHWYEAVPRLRYDSPESLELTISALEGGNTLCLVNDRNIIPSFDLSCSKFRAEINKTYDTPGNMVGGPANCILYTLILGPWYLPALFTIDGVAAGEDLGYSYEAGYWVDHHQTQQLAQGELEMARRFGLAGGGDAGGAGAPLRSTFSAQNPPKTAAAGTADGGVAGRLPSLESEVHLSHLGAGGLSGGGGSRAAAAEGIAAAAGAELGAGPPVVMATALKAGLGPGGIEAAVPGKDSSLTQQREQQQAQAEQQPGPARPMRPTPLPGTSAASGLQPQPVLLSGGTTATGSSGRRVRTFGARTLSERKARTEARAASQKTPGGGGNEGMLGTAAAAVGSAGREQRRGERGAGEGGDGLAPRHLSFEGPDVGLAGSNGEAGTEPQPQEQQQRGDEYGPPAKLPRQEVGAEQVHGHPSSGAEGGKEQGPCPATPRGGGSMRAQWAAGGSAVMTRQRAQREGGAGGVVAAEGEAEQEPGSAAQRAVSEALAELEQAQVAYAELGWDQESWACEAGSLEGELYSAEALLFLHQAGQLEGSLWKLQDGVPLAADAVVARLQAGQRQLREAQEKVAAAWERARREGAPGSDPPPAAAAAAAAAELVGGRDGARETAGAGAGVVAPEQQPAMDEAGTELERDSGAMPALPQPQVQEGEAAGQAGGAGVEPAGEVGGPLQHVTAGKQLSPPPVADAPLPTPQPAPAARPANPPPGKTPAKAAARHATAATHPAKKVTKARRDPHPGSLSPQARHLVQATLPHSWLPPSKAAEQAQQASPSREPQPQQLAQQQQQVLAHRDVGPPQPQQAPQQVQRPSPQRQATQAPVQQDASPAARPSQPGTVLGDVLSVGMCIAVMREGQVQEGEVQRLGASSPHHEHPLVKLVGREGQSVQDEEPTALILMKDKRKVGIMQLLEDGHWAVLPPGVAGPGEGPSPPELPVRAAPDSRVPGKGAQINRALGKKAGIVHLTGVMDGEQQDRGPAAQPVGEPPAQPLVMGQQTQATPAVAAAAGAAAVAVATARGWAAAACTPMQGMKQPRGQGAQRPQQGASPLAVTPGGLSTLDAGLASHSMGRLGLEGRSQELVLGRKSASKQKVNPHRRLRQGGSMHPQLASADPGTAGASTLKPAEPQSQQRLPAGKAARGVVPRSAALAGGSERQAAMAAATGQGTGTKPALGRLSLPAASLPARHPAAVKAEGGAVEAAAAPSSLPPTTNGAVASHPPPPCSATPAAAAPTQPTRVAAGFGNGGHAKKKLKEPSRAPGKGRTSRGVAPAGEGAPDGAAAAQPAGKAPLVVIDLTLDSDEG